MASMPAYCQGKRNCGPGSRILVISVSPFLARLRTILVASGSRASNVSAALTMKVVLALDDENAEAGICEALASRLDIRADFLSRASGSGSYGADGSCLLIVSHEFLQGMYDTDPDILLGLLNRVWIVDAVSEESLRSGSRLTQLGHSWIFLNENLDRMTDVIRMCTAGYFLVPEEIAPYFVASQQRRVEIEQLSLKECALLNELGHGVDDEFIARRLSMSESAVRMLMRSVFAEFHFESRDEACLFAVAHRAEMQNIRKNKIRAQSHAEDDFRRYQSAVSRILEQLEEYPK